AATGLELPFDATPSTDGLFVYYVTVRNHEGVLIKAKADGSNPQDLATGFQVPISIVLSMDGSKVFVADLGDDSATEEGKDGAIFVVSSNGGDKTELTGTRGYEPRGLDLVMTESGELLYFSGTDPADHQNGVFKIPSAGGAASAVAKNDALKDPSGLA